jgi:hypothetical protein
MAGNLRPTPLMAREGVNGRFKRGDQGGGVRGFDWRRNDGGREARGDQLWRGAGNFRPGSAGVGKGVNLTAGAQLVVTEGEGVVTGLLKLESRDGFWQLRQGRAGWDGPSACARRPAVRSGPARARLGRVGRILRKNSFRIKLDF